MFDSSEVLNNFDWYDFYKIYLLDELEYIRLWSLILGT